jgi:MtrB/PioB family decaheme-associated outer membrane protein
MNSYRRKFRYTVHCSLLTLLCAPVILSAAENESPVDTSKWTCEYCAVEQGYSGELEGGAGYVSDPSFKFGEYNGLEDDGAFFIGNATARYRDGKAGYLDLQVRDLGLDTRSLELQGGQQGRYELRFDYDGIPHNISDSARTPYLGSGTDTLSLPSGWVNGSNTAGMTQLNASLLDVELQTLRKRFGVGVDFFPANHWKTSIDVRHETRDGQKSGAGTFMFNAAQLVVPVDYVTDEVEAAATYTTGKWQSKFAYYGSFFNNHDQSLTWQSAYNPLSPGADSGQLALPPDNRFHQLLFSTGYQLSKRTRFSGDLALGRMEQDDALLPATTNANLAVSLPRTSANARVDTVTANLKADTAVNDKLRLNASYRYNDRNNKTPVDLFDWVKTDTFAAIARSNLPYSFTDQDVKLGGDYRFDKRIRFGAGYDYARKDRTNQEVDRTSENTGWAKAMLQLLDNLDVTVKGAHGERDASGYHAVPEVTPPENPLMSKYNLADRSRDSGSIQASYTPQERVSIGVSADFAHDRYAKSLLGLTSSRDISLNADVAVALTDATSLHAFGGREQIHSEQSGSQSYAQADWTARNVDTIDSFGAGVKHQLIKDRLDVGADYVLTRSTGEVRVLTGSPGADFPDLKTRLDGIKLYADYQLKQDMSLHAAYWYEKYDSKDWMLDGVAPDTIDNVLGFGATSPDYNQHAVMFTLRYKF